VARSRTSTHGSLRDRFNELSRRITDAVGAPAALGLAVGVVIIWGLTGPIFGFSDTWQLAMNTTSSIITFCMVFVIQASQNRDSKAIQLKLDEIIRSTSGARNELIDLEVAPEERVNATEDELRRIAAGETLADDADDVDRDARPDRDARADREARPDRDARPDQDPSPDRRPEIS
jgi:low affinity Fe/Cu permease